MEGGGGERKKSLEKEEEVVGVSLSSRGKGVEEREVNHPKVEAGGGGPSLRHSSNRHSLSYPFALLFV